MPRPSHSSRFYHPHDIGWSLSCATYCSGNTLFILTCRGSSFLVHQGGREVKQRNWECSLQTLLILTVLVTGFFSTIFTSLFNSIKVATWRNEQRNLQIYYTHFNENNGMAEHEVLFVNVTQLAVLRPPSLIHERMFLALWRWPFCAIFISMYSVCFINKTHSINYTQILKAYLRHVFKNQLLMDRYYLRGSAVFTAFQVITDWKTL